jgi:hypothetical protein
LTKDLYIPSQIDAIAAAKYIKVPNFRMIANAQLLGSYKETQMAYRCIVVNHTLANVYDRESYEHPLPDLVAEKMPVAKAL